MLGADSTAWPLLVAGTVSALWSASSYLAVFRRALHHMHRVEDQRSPWRRAHRILLTALALLVLLLTGSLALLLTGPLAEDLGQVLGLRATVAWGWSVLRWPLLLFLVGLLVIVVFHTGPAEARLRANSLPGGVLAAVLWLAVSTGFAVYASTLSTYSRLYGSLMRRRRLPDLAVAVQPRAAQRCPVHRRTEQGCLRTRRQEGLRVVARHRRRSELTLRQATTVRFRHSWAIAVTGLHRHT